MPAHKNNGTLYIVATHIGNTRDITIRALETLKTVQAVICEERRLGSTLLKKVGISKELICVNEHNEMEQIPLVIQRLLHGDNLALISDCGTPVFADPGAALLRQVTEQEIPVVPIPGPSSLMAALSVLDYKIEDFIFVGFLSRDTIERMKALQKYRVMRMTVVLMDTPYRLSKLLEEVNHVFGSKHSITLAFDLTLPTERIFRGSVANVRRQLGQLKGEFVLIVHPLKTH